MCVGILPCMYRCTLCTWSACSSQKISWNWSLQMAESCQADAGPSLLLTRLPQPFQLPVTIEGLRRLEGWGQDLFSLT